jgi:hypothetical protein
VVAFVNCSSKPDSILQTQQFEAFQLMILSKSESQAGSFTPAIHDLHDQVQFILLANAASASQIQFMLS